MSWVGTVAQACELSIWKAEAGGQRKEGRKEKETCEVFPVCQQLFLSTWFSHLLCFTKFLHTNPSSFEAMCYKRHRKLWSFSLFYLYSFHIMINLLSITRVGTNIVPMACLNPQTLELCSSRRTCSWILLSNVCPHLPNPQDPQQCKEVKDARHVGQNLTT